jgi:hypothetical protein
VSSRYCLTGFPAPFAGDGDEFASGTGAGAASGSGSGSGSGAAAGSGSAVDVWGCELVSRGWWSRSRSASMGCSFWVVRTCGGFGFGGARAPRRVRAPQRARLPRREGLPRRVRAPQRGRAPRREGLPRRVRPPAFRGGLIG